MTDQEQSAALRRLIIAAKRDDAPGISAALNALLADARASGIELCAETIKSAEREYGRVTTDGLAAVLLEKAAAIRAGG